MIYVSREWVTESPTEEQGKQLFSLLSSRYVPLLQSAISSVLSLLFPSGAQDAAGPGCEIFVPRELKENEERFFYYLKLASGMEVGSIGVSEISDEHNAFVQSVMSVLGGEAKRRRIQSVNQAFAAVYKEWGEFSISPEDRVAARLLEDPAALALLREAVSSLRLALSESGQGPSRFAIDQLEKSGMLKSQFSIFCRQTGNQIMMVDSMEAIEEATRQGFKCFVCGRSFSEEKLTQFVSPTPYGQRMSRENYSLVIRTCEVLQEAFPSERICVVFEGEVANIFLSMENSFLLIEIKESSYSLKNAYLFARKVLLYKPAAGLLLLSGESSGSPGSDASRYLAGEMSDYPFWIENSLGRIRERIPEILKQAYKSHLSEIFGRFTELSSIPVGDYALAYLFPQEVFQPSTRAAAREEPVPVGASVSFSPPEREAKSGTPALVTPAPAAPTPAAPAAKEEPKEEALEVIPTEILEFETRSSVPQAPQKDALIRKMLDELGAGVAGRESSLHILLQDLSDADRRCKACLISQDGLVVASTLQEDISELLASYGSECFALALGILRLQNLSTMSSLAMASENFSIELYPVSGFYLVLATTLETVVTEPLPEVSLPEGLKLVCDRLLSKRTTQSACLLNQDKALLCEAGMTSGKSTAVFPVLLELFSKLTQYFDPIGQGDLLSIAVRTPSNSMAVAQAGAGYIGVTFGADQPFEDLIPHILAVSREASGLFSPERVS